jgi:tetratricopeptide (TPR) repeat protein
VTGKYGVTASSWRAAISAIRALTSFVIVAALRLPIPELAASSQQQGPDQLSIDLLRELRTGNMVEAERLLQKVLDLNQHAADDYGIAVMYEALGEVYQNRFDYSKAEDEFKKAATILQREAEHSQALAVTLRHLGATLLGERRFAEALVAYLQAYKLAKNISPRNPQLELEILNGMGSTYFQQGASRKAEAVFGQALKVKPASRSGPTLDFSEVLINVATLYAEDGRYSKAADAYIRALQLTELRLGSSDPNLVIILDNLGFMYLRIRRYAEAEAQFQRSLALLQKSRLMDNEMAVRTLHGLGQTRMGTGELEQAELMLAKAVEMSRTTKVRASEMLDLLDLYSTLLTRLSKTAQGDQFRTEAARIRAELAFTTRVGR